MEGQPFSKWFQISKVEFSENHWGREVLRFLRPGVLQQLHASNVTDACHQLVQWNMIRMKVEKNRTMMRRKGRCNVDKVTKIGVDVI